MDRDYVIFMSTDGGHSYRQTRVNERGFKDKLWMTACKWLRPDSDMVSVGYGSCIVIRRHDTMAHMATIEIRGGDSMADVWCRICQTWEMITGIYG